MQLGVINFRNGCNTSVSLAVHLVLSRLLLKPTKASGPDEIPARVLKELAHELAPPISKLFQTTYDTGELPDKWKETWISAVYKKGPKSLPANYRPVSLTCILAKLNEHIINTHVRRHIDSHNIITPSQHGFQKRHSCESQLYLTTHDLSKHLDKKTEVHVRVLDFSKAFDVVPTNACWASFSITA